VKEVGDLFFVISSCYQAFGELFCDFHEVYYVCVLEPVAPEVSIDYTFEYTRRVCQIGRDVKMEVCWLLVSFCGYRAVRVNRYGEV
jgi:hypothetical protein